MNAKVINILIVDDDIGFCFLCAQELPKTSEIFSCDIAHDGVEAIEKIKCNNYDIIVLDSIMPLVDGLWVLNEINTLNLKKRPKILAITAGSHSKIASAMLDGGADYFMPKPQSITDLANRLQYIMLSPIYRNNLSNLYSENLNAEKDSNDELFACLLLQRLVSKKVLEYGIPTNLLGYNYSVHLICALITLKRTNPTLSKIYESIAKQYDSDSRCVENAINSAMKVALKSNTPALNDVLKLASLDNTFNFSNSRFFSLLVFDIEQNILSFSA